MRTSHHEQSADEGALELALGAASEMVAKVGGERLEVVTVTRNRVCLGPRDLSDGERIAHELRCEIPLDHRLTVPECTMWTGQHEDLEVQVRAALRTPGTHVAGVRR